jgi:hypothetical protein
MGTDINFNKSLGRTYGTYIGLPAFDPAALAFISAAGITNPTQKTAINNLVIGLKSDGIWTKMKAIYPFVGGTASTHKWNLKDPRDLDAAFRLVFNGGWTHSSTGATPNGTNGYADTKFNPNTQLSITNAHISLYKNLGTISAIDKANGVYNPTTDFSLNADRNLVQYSSGCLGSYSPVNTVVGSSSSVQGNGFYVIARNASNFVRLNKNNSNTLTNTNTNSSASFPNDSMWLGASHLVGTTIVVAPNNYRYAMLTMGEYLDATEAANLYTRVQAYQTSLSRQV